MNGHWTSAGSAVVTLPAEIDIYNAEKVRTSLAAALVPGVEVLVADLTGVTFCDVRGVRALVRAQDEAAAADVELRLAVPPGRVRALLHLIVPDGRLRLYPAVSLAAARPRRPSSL